MREEKWEDPKASLKSKSLRWLVYLTSDPTVLARKKRWWAKKRPLKLYTAHLKPGIPYIILA